MHNPEAKELRLTLRVAEKRCNYPRESPGVEVEQVHDKAAFDFILWKHFDLTVFVFYTQSIL